MKLGISGKIARTFQNSQITPLLALVGLLLGFFAIMVTPKEEEPQIDVTFANVFIAFPGASAKQVEQMVSTPAEQMLSEIKGVDDIFSVSSPGQSVLTVAFEVGIPREEAILNLFNQVYSNNDWLPQNLGVMPPVVKPMGIDDVPIMAITLSSARDDISAQDLTKIAHALEIELKRIAGTRDIYTIGGQASSVEVRLNPTRMNGFGLAFDDVRNTLLSANAGGYIQPLVQNNQVIQVQAGSFLKTPEELGQLVVGYSSRGIVYLADVADIQLSADTPEQAVYTRAAEEASSHPAVTLAIAKQPGMNAIDITQAIEARLAQLQNHLIPQDVKVDISRDYGVTAKQKSDQLMGKLLFATLAVVLLVLLAMSWREAVIVGAAIAITLTITLFASWVWGFTLNRVSLFALIFSIGILVDDAIVVVENIHRHIAAGGSLKTAIPGAVDEVGGPTILATFTVIAALLPMAFVSGLMGPYMSPIPINASMGMMLSLIIALVVTPWLARRWLAGQGHEQGTSERLQRLYTQLMNPLFQSRRRRYGMGFGLIALIMVAFMLVGWQAVVMKMLPFDNKSEVKLVVDMPEGSSLEQTNAVLMQMATALDAVDEVISTQIYAGTSSPIGFNGLVRQYYLREAPHLGDIQVTLAHARERDRTSHDIARSLRPLLDPIAAAAGAALKVVEVPPGPPVLAPIVAEVYGPSAAAREQAARTILAQFDQVEGIVDSDTTLVSNATEEVWAIQRERAAQLGVSVAQVAQVVETALAGVPVTYIAEPGQLQPTPVILRLPPSWQGQLSQLQSLTVTSQTTGAVIPIVELLERQTRPVAQPIYHKDLRPVIYVTGDMAGRNDSPLYGLFGAAQLIEYPQSYIAQPDLWNQVAIKWDGEWQITYETFRDMGLAYAVGLFLIYLLVVAHFGDYRTPLVIMAPIPLTLIGILPGHALLNAQFTATSMIGMIALAGIIVRNSILLVDFIQAELKAGKALEDAVIEAAAVRTKPIILTAVAAMLGAFFILDDPIFNGLAVSLVFGLAVSTLLTLVVIPQLYAAQCRRTLLVQRNAL